MSKTLTLELPEDAFSILRTSPEEFGRELRLAAAVKWYEVGRISQGKAAELAGVSRAEFIDALESRRPAFASTGKSRPMTIAYPIDDAVIDSSLFSLRHRDAFVVIALAAKVRDYFNRSRQYPGSFR